MAVSGEIVKPLDSACLVRDGDDGVLMS